MLPIDPQIDPIVEILRLAYRRGLALRQEQSQAKGGAIDLDPEDKPTQPEGVQPEELQVQAGN